MPLNFRQKTISLFVISIFVVAVALYTVFDRFLMTTGEEIVKAWFHGDFVALQEGQIYSSISKNQNVFQKSPFIRAVVLVDASQPDRFLFSVGTQNKDISAYLERKKRDTTSAISSFRSGFLSNSIVVALPGKSQLFLIYDISSSFLIWSYLATVALGIFFVTYLIWITKSVAEKERVKREQIRTDLFRRLAHDINSPLLAISSVACQLNKMDRQLNTTLEKATESIRRILVQTDKVNTDITTQVQIEDLESQMAFDRESELVPFAAMLTDLLQTKRSEYSSLENLSIECVGLNSISDVFVKLNVDEFRRHFSNILKNAVEATSKVTRPKILLKFTRMSDLVVLEVTDNGHGIPAELISELGKKGVTRGKTDGQGLGLHFAMASIKYWNGFVNIESEVGTATTIRISLPLFDTPLWFKHKLARNPIKKLVLVDDDETMEDRWRNQFNLGPEEYYFFNSASSFKTWFFSGGQFEDNLEFFFDYHLDAENTGIQLIDELGIASESTLVTSAYLDQDIVSRVKQSRVQLLPKVMIGISSLQ